MAAVRSALVTAVVLLACVSAGAHHGFTGRYDTDRPIWLTGTVTAISAAPPHAVLTLLVDRIAPAPPASGLPEEFTGAPAARPDDAGQSRTIELAPAAQFFALGGQLKPGDRIEILALRNCRPPHQLRSQWLRLADGTVVQRTGRLSYMSAGCGGP